MQVWKSHVSIFELKCVFSDLNKAKLSLKVKLYPTHAIDEKNNVVNSFSDFQCSIFQTEANNHTLLMALLQ